MKEKIGLIGAGTVATTFAVKLAEGGFPVVAVADAKPAMAQRMAGLVKGCQIYDTNQGVVDAADLVIIATYALMNDEECKNFFPIKVKVDECNRAIKESKAKG